MRFIVWTMYEVNEWVLKSRSTIKRIHFIPTAVINSIIKRSNLKKENQLSKQYNIMIMII